MVKKPVLEIDKSHFVVKLHEDTLELDLKEGAKKMLEDAVEAHPILRESLGVLFQTTVPLDVALKDMESAEIDDKGRLKIVIPLRRDLIIPLEVNESKRLAQKLNELIPLARMNDTKRTRALEDIDKRPKSKMTRLRQI